MAIKVAVHRVCDRCQHPFDTSSLKYGEELPKFKSTRVACTFTGPKGENADKILFCYEDLCGDCDRIVDGYIKRIRMEEPDEAKPKKSKKSEKLAEAVPVGVGIGDSRFEPTPDARDHGSIADSAFEPPAAEAATSQPPSPDSESLPKSVAADAVSHPF
jgi:hypothetical protein